MLELLTEIAPGLKRVAMIFNSDTAPGRGTYYFRDFEAAARSSKLEPIAADARSDDRNRNRRNITWRRAPRRTRCHARLLYVQSLRADHIASSAKQCTNRLSLKSVVAGQGGLLSYGPDLLDIVRRSGPYVDKILRGANPADLPVQVPVKFELAVNAKTAKVLGLTVPPSILLRADEVIE
jgi:ABC transporter substrate binding protein